MEDHIPNTMNLDLNLGLLPSLDDEMGSGSLPNESVNLEDWIGRHVSRVRETLRAEARQRWQSVWRPVPIPPETRNNALELLVNSSSAGGDSLQTGEVSASPEERNPGAIKTCENNVTHGEDEVLGKNEDNEKVNGEEGSFFDCNICLDLAKDPVVTCCGHLFCWPCLYQWIHVHSNFRECPVCKGEVTLKNLTPIYGRGTNMHEPEEDPSLKIPLRPQARRVESRRQTIQRNAFTIPLEEMIRRLGVRFDLTRDFFQVHQQNTEGVGGSPERNSSLIARILTSRGMRREQNTLVPPDDAIDVDLTHDSPANSGGSENRRFSSLLLRRSRGNRAATNSILTSALSSAERLVESYYRYRPQGGNQEQLPSVDDRGSMSSIAAVIHSDSQTVDTAVEMDSTVAISTSTSRRRNDASRVSDVDSGDSRAHRRRRLN